jgi:hypothetical protein
VFYYRNGQLVRQHSEVGARCTGGGGGAAFPHVCAPARRPPEANLAELVGCPHPPGCRVLGLLTRRTGQLPESALRRRQSGPKWPVRGPFWRTFARPRDARRKRIWPS